MRPFLRTLFVISASSLLLGGDCMFGRPIVDDKSRFYPSDDVISCTGTRCSSLPDYDLALPPPLDETPCAQDLPTAELGAAAQAGNPLAGMRYVLESERPLDSDLGTLDLRDACLVLSGPVHLTLGADSKLANVTVLLGPGSPAERDAGAMSGATPEASDDDSGSTTGDETDQPIGTSPSPAFGGTDPSTPTLNVGYAVLDRVVLQAFEETKPSGSAQIEFSTCTRCEARIDLLNVIESNVTDSRLGAGTLNIVGGALDAVELSFDYGLLAGLVAKDVRTVACSKLSLLGSTIAGRASQIGPCDCAPSTPELITDVGQPDARQPNSTCNGATISQTTFLAGMVDGRIHAENSSFQSVLFARHVPTALDIWSGQIGLSVICDEPMDIRLDRTAIIACSSCDSAKAVTACALNDAPPLALNVCKSFRGKLPACEPPLPTRTTPPIRPPKW